MFPFFFQLGNTIFVSMNYADILKELKSGVYRPIYFLMGDEPYFIDVISDYIIANALPEADRGFNQLVMYGKDLDVMAIIHAARKYPMMARRQLVVIREAQNIKDIEELSVYAEKPLESTILVVCYKYKSLDKRRKLGKLVEKNGVLFESKKLYDNQLPKWIEDYSKSAGLNLDSKSVMLLAEFIGSDLSALVLAIDKLKVVVPADIKVVTADVIEKNIGFSKDFNNFELQSAIINRDILKANRIVKYFAANPKSNPIQATVVILFNFFQKVLAYHYLPNKSSDVAVAAELKITPYFVKDYAKAAQTYGGRKVVNIISLLREYDMKSKGFGSVSVPDGELLAELVYKIMH